jgi:hypothetical protein
MSMSLLLADPGLTLRMLSGCVGVLRAAHALLRGTLTGRSLIERGTLVELARHRRLETRRVVGVYVEPLAPRC